MSDGFLIFFSYATADKNADAPLFKFLREEISEVIARTKPEGRLVTDQVDLTVGTDNWEEKLGELLGACQAMIAITSDSYFRSETCGREWNFFLQRKASDGRTNIIAVPWHQTKSVPTNVRRHQFLRGKRCSRLEIC